MHHHEYFRRNHLKLQIIAPATFLQSVKFFCYSFYSRTLDCLYNPSYDSYNIIQRGAGLNAKLRYIRSVVKYLRRKHLAATTRFAWIRTALVKVIIAVSSPHYCKSMILFFNFIISSPCSSIFLNSTTSKSDKLQLVVRPYSAGLTLSERNTQSVILYCSQGTCSS